MAIRKNEYGYRIYSNKNHIRSDLSKALDISIYFAILVYSDSSILFALLQIYSSSGVDFFS